MMLSSLLMLVLGIILYNIFWEVNSAGVPYEFFVEKSSILNENTNLPAKTAGEYLNGFNYKLEAMNQMMNKMDNSLQSLQEKSQAWAIFQHHINSWNDVIRVLENKLDLLKQAQEEQHQQIQKLEFLITDHNKISKRDELLLEDVKEFLLSERKNKDQMFSKITNLIKQVQLTTACNERKTIRKANFMAPIDVSPMPKQPSSLGANASIKIEQRLNTLIHQVALQKDLKQLNALEKRNSKSLENINQVLRNQLDKYEDMFIRLQKSNECCNSVSNELTTFTESSDTLLKRIEELVRNVSFKLNDIEIREHVDEHSDDDDDIGNESEETEIEEKIFNHDLNAVDVEKELQEENINGQIDVAGFENNATEMFEYDDSQDVEFLRPSLTGCHDLLDDDNDRIDHIYRFSQPDINEINRDFNERYCVFPQTPNDTGMPWTVIQRRGPYQQQENFNRSWAEYRNGFGHLSRDFWFGNEFIHRLVYHDDYELRIELEDFDGAQMWAEYSVFRIDSEKYNYNLLIGGHRGTVEDAMKYHNDNDFSTYDKRNDKTIDACCSCAMGYASGWWFDNCSEANLNGIYHGTPLGHNYIGIMWELWRGDYSLKKTRMMIRPHSKPLHNATEDAQHFNDYTEDP